MPKRKLKPGQKRKGMTLYELNDGFKDRIREMQREAYMKRVGKTYGDYTVRRIAYDEKMRCQVWEVQCNYCGRYWVCRTPQHLVSGQTGRCYCQKMRRKAEKENARLHEDRTTPSELGAVSDGDNGVDSVL